MPDRFEKLQYALVFERIRILVSTEIVLPDQTFNQRQSAVYDRLPCLRLGFALIL